jgi:hypothetical protein
VTFARWACRLTRLSKVGNCLERSLLTYRFLGAVDANPCLVVGVRHGAMPDGLRGHAWVVVDGVPAGESLESVDDFASIVVFRADGSRIATGDLQRSGGTADSRCRRSPA